nr:MAG TPA: hypothetical protein [Caudoviricetes sp.]
MHGGISLHSQLVLATQGTIRIISSIPVRLLKVYLILKEKSIKILNFLLTHH